MIEKYRFLDIYTESYEVEVCEDGQEYVTGYVIEGELKLTKTKFLVKAHFTDEDTVDSYVVLYGENPTISYNELKEIEKLLEKAKRKLKEAMEND